MAPDRAVFDEALESPALFQRLMHAEWHYANERYESASKLAKLVQRDALGKPAISRVAEGSRTSNCRSGMRPC